MYLQIMNLFLTYIIMKTKCKIFLVIFGFSLSALSQVTISLGVYTGASSTNSLLATSTTVNRYSRTMSIYTVAEINLAGGIPGTITSLAWEKYGIGEYLFDDAYIKIYLKHATNDVWSTSPVPVWDTEIVGATEVFTSNTFSIPAGTGWKTMPFTTPFVWNGTSNIVVMVEWYRPSTPTADINWGRSTDASTNATRVGSTSLAALVMIVNSNRPLLQLTFSDPVDSVSVATQGNVPAIINTDGGTLQMEATVYPLTANQNVTWSIVNGTGEATISTAGLVTASENGTVWAKAVSAQDQTKMDSLMITISNQQPPVASLSVSTQGSVPAVITTPGGTLQMVATVLPVNANQDVTWSIVPGTGSAVISTSGLVTAQTNGTVWAKAVSDQNNTIRDSLMITISNQPVPITGLTVSTQGSVPPEITTPGGTLQMVATVLPANAVQDVTWSIIPGSGSAVISTSGLVTAQTNGTIWAKAVSDYDISKLDSLEITITNQDMSIENVLAETGFIMYPNPVSSGNINFELSETIDLSSAQLMILDINGKTVRTEVIQSAGFSISVTNLPSGLYTVVITDQSKTYTSRFILEK
jgi:sorbitol-specific phosphotransferase system component IIA